MADPAHLTQLTPLLCIVCGTEGGADIAANLLLFLPLAVGLRLAGLSWRRAVLCCAATSFTVELLQLVAIPGRDASLSDLLSNTTSAAIGATLVPHLPAAFLPSPRASLRLLVGGSAVWVAALGLAGWLLGPWMPGGPFISRWAHEVEAPWAVAFDGRVAAVRMDGVAMPKRGAPPDSAELRRRLDAGTFTLDADVTSGRLVRDPSWIYTLRGPWRGALAMYQAGRNAGVAVPVRGLRFRFRPVTVTLADGLPAEAGVPVHLRATARHGVIRLQSVSRGAARETEFGLSPAYGWRLVWPFEAPSGQGARWFSALCLALSVAPLGYWAGRAGRRGLAIPWLAVALGGGLAVVPRLTGLPPVDRSEWLAAGLGAAAGWALHGAAAYLERRCASPSASESSSS